MATYRKRDARWQVQVRKLGHHPISRTFKSRADAEVWARGVEERIDRGALPTNYSQLRSTRLADLLRRYRETISPRKKSHYKERCRLLRLEATPMADLTLDRITPAVFAEFRDSRLKHVGPQAVRHDLNVLGHMFKIAMREWDTPLSRNPLEAVTKPPMPRARTRRLNAGEFNLLETAAFNHGGALAKDIIGFAVETALRRSELLSVQWANVDLEKSTLLIPETKNGHPRTIPLTAKAKEIISSRSSDADRVFPVTSAWLRYTWGRLRQSVGSIDLHFHDLRHEAISRFFEKGLSVPEVALISGHRDVRQLFRYTHLRAEDVAKKLA
jgi:integrase